MALSMGKLFQFGVRGALVVLLALPTCLLAQPSRPEGSIAGVVTDPTGALIPNADVVLHPSGHTDNRADISAITTSRGAYSFMNLAPGSYTITAQASGFAIFQSEPIAVSDRTLHVTVNVQLDIAVREEHLEVSSEDTSLTADPNRNGDAIVLTQSDIEAMPYDPDQFLLQLQTMAGSTSAAIYVDGFSGQGVPPQSSIREIRINQNPYSAQNDSLPSNGSIQIFTKPGSAAFHGDLQAYGNESAFNARIPVLVQTAVPTPEPPYYLFRTSGDLSGPIIKNKASFSLNAGGQSRQTDAIVDASTLDANFNQTQLVQAISNPTTGYTISPRLDLQASKNNAVMLRYSVNQIQQTNAGIGQFDLPSQGYGNTTTTQFLQAMNTQTIGAKIIDETRFQYTRTRVNQTPVSPDPTIVVQGAFTGGGNNLDAFHDNQDRYEFQDYISVAPGKHYLNFGVRLRALRDSNYSSANFNGEYIFPTLAAYQITEQDTHSSQMPPPTPADILAAGGGASQFNLNTGNPSAAVTVFDEAAFIQDDFKLSPNLTLSGGLRFESQNHMSNHADWAPRFGASWGFDNDKSKHPRYVLRGGFGLFYLRFPSSNILQAARQNGVSQQEYVISAPQFFPNTIPSTTSLGAQTQPTIYAIASNFHAGYYYSTTIGLDRQIGKNVTVSTSYVDGHGLRRLITLNVNAPLPGTYNSADPTSGVRPYGGTQNIYQYASEGTYNAIQLMANTNIRVGSRMSMGAFYQARWAKTDDNDYSFPSNSYNIHADYGRAGNDNRNRAVVFGNWTLPRDVQISGFIQYQSGTPFNITVGQDLNGDSQYNDRPAFATDLTRPSVVTTRWGAFDTSPIPGQTIIPIFYAQGPANYYLNFTVGKTFHFGPEPKTIGKGPSPPKPGAPPPRKYSLSVSASSFNPFNHVNLAPPVGVLNSPLFGTSTSLNGQPRTINLQTYFRF